MATSLKRWTSNSDIAGSISATTEPFLPTRFPRHGHEVKRNSANYEPGCVWRNEGNTALLRDKLVFSV